MATITITQQTNKTRVLLTATIVLIWFILILGGSVFGTFASFPPLFYLVVGGPVVLYVGAYLLSDAFRRFVHVLVGDPWVITAIQIYRVLGVSMAIQALRYTLPSAFGLPAGFGDLFIGITAPLAALAWLSGTRSGKIVFVLWNILGLLDLIAALSLASLAPMLQPGPITMAPLRIYPLSLIPAFGVPLAFILHFTGLAQLWHLSREQEIA